MDLPIRDLNRGVFQEVPAGFPIAALRRSTANHTSQSRSVAAFQTQSRVSWAVPLPAVKIVIPVDMHWAEKTGDLQMTAVDKTLLGARLERSIELIDQILHHGLKHLAASLEHEFAEGQFEAKKALLGRALLQELFDDAGGFFFDGCLDFVAFFFDSGDDSVRVMATVVSINSSASFSNCLRPSMASAKASTSSAGTRRVRFSPFSQT